MKISSILFIVFFSLLITFHSFSQARPKTGKININPKTQKLLSDLADSEGGPQRVNILLDLAWINMRGDPGQTLYYIRQALALSEKINDSKSLAHSIHMMGLYLHNQGNFPGAMEYYSKSLKIKEELGDRKGISSSYNNIGIIYEIQGNYPLALEYFFKSLKIREELGDRKGIASNYNNIGIIYNRQGNYSLALEYYFKSLKIKEELGNRHKIANSYNNIGNVYSSQGNYPMALEYFFKSVKLKQELGDRKGIVSSYNNIGLIYEKQGNYSTALKCFFKSLKISEQLGDKRGLSYTFQSIGSCYIKMSDSKKGIDYLTRALELAQILKQAETIRDSAGELSRAYAKLKLFEPAYQYFMLFKEKSDELRNKEKDKKITQLAMQYKFDKKQQQVQIELDKRKTLIYALMVSSVLLVLLLFFIYSRFHLKKKSNLLLVKQQEEIVMQATQLETVNQELHLLNVTKDKFFSIIAHDLKNPFNALLGFLAPLITEFDSLEKEEIKENLELIYKSSENTYNLLKNLLDWARAQAGKIKWQPEKIELREILAANLELLGHHARKKNIRLESEITEEAVVFADGNMLNTVTRNLISNGIKFTPPGGKINIRAIEVDHLVEIRVTDNGIGISEKDIPKLFSIDANVSRPGTADEVGTGLGLILCKEFIEKNGGNIYVESRVNIGTTFCITLPRIGT